MKITKKELLTNVLLEKNTTFLLGAGASAPFFSSLGNFEFILSHPSISSNGKNLIKIFFYEQSIANNSYLLNYLGNVCYCGEKAKQMEQILDEYIRFVHNSLEFLKVRNSRVSPKRVNIVTTNYDLFFESAIEKSIENNPRIFFNDGANGYMKRILNTDNFNKTLLYSGVFDNYSSEMPVINLIKCHGSINWEEYNKSNTSKPKVIITPHSKLIPKINELLSSFIDKLKLGITEPSFTLNNDFSTVEDFLKLLNTEVTENIVEDINKLAELSKKQIEPIIAEIEKLQIVLPTKRKFQTTVIEEHYFNMLRLLSYELEKEQSALIVFGFSFYDEHISDVVQRSLNNPNLLILIMCYQDGNKEDIISKFNFSLQAIPSNIVFIEPKDFLIEEMTEQEFTQKYEDTDLSQYTIIKNEGQVKIYSKDVNKSLYDETQVPILNFSSFNSILEEEFTNKYQSVFLNEEGEEIE
ncbi:hypothetical protein GM58_00595 [Listeria monocytogenes]|nr:hypothetical protein [Listeria monocytogenes]EAE1795593.1 hypothetical protein [Listeria monocytogenes]EAH4336790.1 hypothetical protein [Listeria monocytogenes]EIZ6617273.1 hypothetical protein [Listeria monocytogenes]EKZ3809892.1 hypothetical protein [Listeria monocytogenes]